VSVLVLSVIDWPFVVLIVIVLPSDGFDVP
jgi:hypothetical protein